MKYVLFAVGLTLGAASSLAQANTVLTASLFTPAHHPISKSITGWCDDVTQATEKRVRCNLLPKAVAGPAGAFDAVRAGVADIAFSVHGYMPGRFVLTQVAEFPFGGDSAEATSIAYQRIHERYLAAIGEHRGLKVLTVFTHGPGNLYNSKTPVTSLENMQRLKWRVGGGMTNALGEALAINVTLKPAPESFALLSTRVIDGILFPTGSIVSFGLDELVQYRTSFPGGLYNTSFAVVMNPAAWERISESDQKAIEKLSGEHLAARLGRAWDEDDRIAREKLEAQGVGFTKASPEFIGTIKQRISGLQADWVEKAKAQGLENPAEVLEAYRSEVEKLSNAE